MTAANVRLVHIALARVDEGPNMAPIFRGCRIQGLARPLSHLAVKSQHMVSYVSHTVEEEGGLRRPGEETHGAGDFADVD